MLPLLGLAALASASAQQWSFRGTQHTAKLTARSPTICDPTVRQHAGTYDIDNGTKGYFYWAFAARNPSLSGRTPTVLWMTGGPGCSSSTALFEENGPCQANSAGDGTVLNPNSWNTFANIIFIDQPAGVGFSTGPLDVHDEAGVVEDMYQFLQAFFKDHPDWNHDFYIFGESYGGHFAPATAHRVWLGARRGEGIAIRLSGLGVGNGLVDPEEQYKHYGQVAYNWSIQIQGHPVVNLSQYEKMVAAVPACIAKIHRCNNGGSWAECTEAQSFCNSAEVDPYQGQGRNPYDIRKMCGPQPLCYNFTNVDAYLNRPDVQKELGVSNKWQSCNDVVNGKFSGDWMKNFQTMIPDLLADGIRVLIYAGDVDYVCNWFGVKAWTLALDWAGAGAFAAARDRPWTAEGRTAGVSRSAQGLTFLQVHWAGHMVPMDQPEASLRMLYVFLRNETW